MVSFFASCVLALALNGLQAAAQNVTASTVVVTRNITATVTLPAPPVVTVTRIISRSSWTATTTGTSTVDCVWTVYGTAPAPTTPAANATVPAGSANATAPAPPSATSGRATPVAEADIFRRQNATSSSSLAVPVVTSTTRVIVATVTRSRPARTSTIYAATTLVQSTVLQRTGYLCQTTLSLLYAVDTTTTVSIPRTAWQSTVTTASTIVCPGIGGFPFGYTPDPTPQPSTPSSSMSMPMPTPTSSSTTRAVLARQTTSTPSSSSSAASTTASSSAAASIVHTSSTVHLTNTAYTVVTTTMSSATTRINYACSQLPYDVSVTIPVLRTVWPSTTTVVSYIDCSPRTPSAAPPAGASKPAVAAEKRQTTSSSTSASSTSAVAPKPSQTLHRTSYVMSTTTVTMSNPSTRLLVSCSTTAVATTSVAPAPTTSTTSSAKPPQ